MARKKVNSYAVFQNVNGTVSINLYYQGGGADTIPDLNAKESKYIIDLLRNEKPISYDHNLRRLSTLSLEPVGESEGGYLDPVFSLHHWLDARPAIRNAINWEFPGGVVRNYIYWSAGEKAALENNYNTVLRNQQLNLGEAPPLAYTPQGTEQAVTRLSAQVAWNYYIGHVAQSLVVEADKRVNWSLMDQTNEEKTILLDGRSFFNRRNDNTYNIDRSNIGGVTYGNPSRLYRFLEDNNLIASNHFNTIANVIGWSRELVHFTGANEAANVFDQWQYWGLPPIERVINGTVKTSSPGDGVKRRTGGCRGTTGFLRALLRIVNIPVKPEFAAGHALPGFPSVDRYLSHGDDPYNQLFKSAPEIPNRELLITQATFNQWFVGNPNAEDNVGRQTRELALQYLSNYLLKMHCNDLAAGRNHANSTVAEVFERNYTVAQLEAMNLWTRMDTKIAALGGCGAIP